MSVESLVWTMIHADDWNRVWLDGVRTAYKLTYHERLAQLRGKRIKSFDDRGLHPVSEQWGRVTLAEANGRVGELIAARLLPTLSPHSLKTMASVDAYEDFITGLREERVSE